MVLIDYVKHYFSFPGILWFALFSAGVLILIHAALLGLTARSVRKDPHGDTPAHTFLVQREMYAELLFSATSILLFVGIYFLISFRYFDFPETFYTVWDRYSGLFLIAALAIAILLVDLFDHFVIPVRRLSDDVRGALRIFEDLRQRQGSLRDGTAALHRQFAMVQLFFCIRQFLTQMIQLLALHQQQFQQLSPAEFSQFFVRHAATPFIDGVMSAAQFYRCAADNPLSILN